MSDSRLKRCLEPGLSVLVGSADAAGMPSCCRGLAISTPDDLQTITVYVPIATSHETIQNVGVTKRLAVTVTHPRDNFATQFKGRTIEARLAHEDEAAFVRANLTHWPAFAVTMRVEQTFDQTPGPNAGCAVA
jgi:hypothetical protein